jgi:acylpyruvate hydrolase
MNLVTLQRPDSSTPGVLLGEGVLDLSACADSESAKRLLSHSVRALLEGGDEALAIVRHIVEFVAKRPALLEQLRQTGAIVPRDKAVLLAPIPDPGLVLACGRNYRGRSAEMKTPPPGNPGAFAKSAASIVGPGASIVLPASYPGMVDWEGEFSVVFGRRCHNVSAEQALDYVAGYTLVNDVSARDWVAGVFASSGLMGPIEAWDRNRLGKMFPTFCPMGPSIATKDEIPDPGTVRLVTRLNGEVMQDANTSDLVFGVPELIAYFSRFYLFRPGDILTTGSPEGVGYARDPKRFLRAGDTIEVEVEGIGVLSNPVAASAS